MFNLKYHKPPGSDLILEEMRMLGMYPGDNGFNVLVGDDNIHCHNTSECCKHVIGGIEELRREAWETWSDLGNTAQLISQSSSENSGCLNNLIFLNSVKKSFLLSKVFSDLSDVTDKLKSVLDVDISDIHENLVRKFNTLYLRTRLIHYLIMSELYRLNVIHKWAHIKRLAQVSGPWANLDLPMKERVWEWSEDEEYFENREKARQEQTRYNPEYNKQGFFFVWQDLNRDPYKFEDMKTDSPYKSRHYLTIP